MLCYKEICLNSAKILISMNVYAYIEHNAIIFILIKTLNEINV